MSEILKKKKNSTPLINFRQRREKKLNDDACSELVNFTVNVIVSYQDTF